jgi:hypothetical protein
MATITTDSTEITEGQTLEDRLLVRLEFLKKNRDEYVATAQRQLAALDAAIGELSALLNPASPNGREDGADEQAP